MLQRLNHTTGSWYEEAFGYSRAVQVGRRLWIAGTIGYDYNSMTIDADPAAQTRQCLKNMAPVFDRLKIGFDTIVRMDLYVTRADIIEPVRASLRPALGDCATTVTVLRFPYDDEVLVELRPFAVLPEEKSIG